MWHFILMFSTWPPLIKWLSNCHNRFVKRLLLVPRLAAQQPAGPSASLPSHCQLARWEFTTPPLFYRYGFLIWDRRYQALSYLKGKTKERCQNLYILRQHAILNRAKLGVKTSSAEGRLGPQCSASLYFINENWPQIQILHCHYLSAHYLFSSNELSIPKPRK